jgi:hypothetical protein
VKNNFYRMFSNLQKRLSSRKVFGILQFVPLIRRTYRWRRWSTSGMIQTEEKRSTQRETCSSNTLSTTDLTRSDLSTNPGSRGVIGDEVLFKDSGRTCE